MSRAPLHALQGFMAAARLGNLTRAAEANHLTVSALSHQMRSLEQRLGQKLIERGARGIKLTPDGQRLFDSIAPHLDAIERALRPYPARRDSVLSLSLMASVANSWLLPRLGGFVVAHPEIELNLHTDAALVDFERDRDLIAAMRYGPGHWPGVEADHLFDDWITPVASPELLARLGPIKLCDLADLPLLGDPGGRWPEWFHCFGQGKPPPRFVASFTDSESLQRAAAEGLGIALARMTLARPLLDTGRLVSLCEDRLPSEYAHYLVYPARSRSHRAFQMFREWILAEAKAYRERRPQRPGSTED